MTGKGMIIALLALAAPLPTLAAPPASPLVERTAPDRLKISWSDANGVDVYMADQPESTPKTARLVSPDDRDGVHEVAVAPGERAYFLLRDHRDGQSVRVAERVLPLEQGSNFRDIGGYPAAGGRHVKWGMIYRSGATPLLTPADQQAIGRLGLANMVDLRSSEERQLAPSRIDGVPYNAVGYSMTAIFTAMKPAAGQAAASPSDALYRQLPQMLAPQMRLLFARLLERQGPLVYNCSAGQDRTGFATAMILSALGVPRQTILADYLLSTRYRHPEFEMARFVPAAFPDNPAAKMFAQYKGQKPQPLMEPDGTPYLVHAFDAIDQRYGSVDAYLAKEAGVTAVDLAALKAAYLE